MDWRAYARAAARRRGLDEGVFEAQIGQESNFRPDARSPAGALGIAQIMPATARGWGVDPMNPRAALNAAADNMAKYLHQFGNIEDALRAYNAGPGAVQKSRGYGETNEYVKRIMAAAHRTGRSAPAASGSSPRQASTNPLAAMQQPTGPNYFQQLGQMTPVNVAGTSPQLQQLQQTTQKNWQLMGDIQNSIMNAAMRQSPSPAAGTSDFDTSAGQTSTNDKNLPSGVKKFEGSRVAAWIAPALEYARAQGWKGQVNSGFRSYADQQRIYNSGVRPAAKPGTSNHEGTDFPRGAVDVSDAEQLAEILKRSKYRNLLVWAGSKDPVHFSHPHNGSY